MKKLFRISPQRGSRNPVVFSWQPEGNYLATASNAVVQIYNRHGERIDEINLSGSGRVLSLEWDKSGESLAVLQDENGQIPIWDLSTSKVQQLETNLRDPTFLKWSQTGSQLAIGTQKGNLLIFNKATKKVSDESVECGIVLDCCVFGRISAPKRCLFDLHLTLTLPSPLPSPLFYSNSSLRSSVAPPVVENPHPRQAPSCHHLRLLVLQQQALPRQ